METPAIVTQALSRHFGAVRAVDSLNLEVPMGLFLDSWDPTVLGKQQPYGCCWDCWRRLPVRRGCLDMTLQPRQTRSALGRARSLSITACTSG